MKWHHPALLPGSLQIALKSRHLFPALSGGGAHPTALREDTVDLWDLTRLLIRRWYVAVPMLLVSVAVVLVAGQSVKPD